MKFSTSTLDNGLTVITDHIPDAKGAMVRWSLRAGGRQDEFAGAAHFFEHLLACSPQASDGDEILKRFQKISSDYNFMTGNESIGIYAKVLPGTVPEIVETIGHTIRTPRWTPHIFEREKSRIVTEFRDSAASPNRTLYKENCAVSYSGHALSQSILGPLENIHAMTEDHCMGYWDRQFKADRMSLTVSGPLPHNDIVNLANDAFGTIASGGSVIKTKPDFKTMQSHAVVAPCMLEDIAIAFENPHTIYSDGQSAFYGMYNLLEIHLGHVFSEAGVYGSPSVGGLHFTDTTQDWFRYDMDPNRVEETLGLILTTLHNPAPWLQEERFIEAQNRNHINQAFTFLAPDNRAGAIDHRFVMTGDAVPFESFIAEDDALTFAQVEKAYATLQKDRFNVFGYGPLDSLPKPADLNRKFGRKFDL